VTDAGTIVAAHNASPGEQMTVKVVTDSTSDIPPEVAEALGISIVPVYVRFDDEVYRDGVDITNEAFYRKLEGSFVQPTTSPPTRQDFATVYANCPEEADGIVSIHVSARASATLSSALQGKKLVKHECQIEVVDSHLASVGLALVVMSAARMAQAGDSLPNILSETHRAIGQVRMLGVFDTMKYLVLGGRISRATASIAGVLNIKPLLTFRDGELVREGLVRTYSQGIARLYDLARSTPSIRELAVAHSNVPDQAGQLKEQLVEAFPGVDIHFTRIGAGIGVHGGPGVLMLALR
jgi:DegV family protein with EDD domain